MQISTGDIQNLSIAPRPEKQEGEQILMKHALLHPFGTALLKAFFHPGFYLLQLLAAPRDTAFLGIFLAVP